MRKIIQCISNPRTTMEPFFDILNTYLKELLNGKRPEHTKQVQEGLNLWNELDCENCDECLFCKPQSWIEDLGTNAWDLCDIIEKMSNGKLKLNKRVDIMDVPGLKLPGSAYSSQ